MGTVVLSPQDCLSSSHNLPNYYFPSPRKPETGRRFSQALMAPLPAAEDCTRHDYSGGSPPGDGLLPIPQPHGQARALSKRSPFASKPSSILYTPPARRTAGGSLSAVVKPKLSRSSSAILPTPLPGSPPGEEGDGLHLLKGRLPFKIVQGNGPGNNKVDLVQRNNSKKPKDARSGPHKKMSGVNGNELNAKKIKGGLQDSRSKLKPPSNGAFLREQTKKVDERNGRSLERSHSVKAPREKCEQDGGIPVVTILQRPPSKEAAAELLTKFFQKSAEEASTCLNEGQVNCMSENMWNHHEMSGESEIEQQSNSEGLSDTEVSEDRLNQTISSPSTSTVVLGAVQNKYVKGSPIEDAINLESDVGTFRLSKGTVDLMHESLSEELASWERWAGPSYINSPPPSALPLPRFTRKQLKIEPLAGADLFEEFVSNQDSTPSSISPLYACLSGHGQLGANLDSVMTATKDLKRILNLDLCRM